jgi:DNA-binding XRE family transcriptional regulator
MTTIPLPPPLLPGQRIGTKDLLVHCNRSNHPHLWEFRPFPEFQPYPEGARLRAARKDLRLTQRAAAAVLQLSAVDYSHLEHGRLVLTPKVSMEDLIHLLRARSAGG